MPVSRSTEVVVLPGKMEAWREIAKEAKSIVDNHNTTLRYLQVASGGRPGTIYYMTFYEDFPAMAASGASIAAEGKLAELQRSLADREPTVESISTAMMQNIDDRVGGPAVVVENATVFAVTRLKINQGMQQKWIDARRQVRELNLADGRRGVSIWASIFGTPPVVSVVGRFVDMAEWAERRANPPDQLPAVADVAEKLREDPDYPYAETLGNTLLTDITDQL